MRNRASYIAYYNYLLLTPFKKRVVRDYRKYCKKKKGHALLYYKTDPLTPGYINDYTHTNNWEIMEIARILNTLGFWVDVIDRSVGADLALENKYDVFIGNGCTDSSRHYPTFARKLPDAIKIFYATTANPDVHNERLRARHEAFTKRTGQKLPIKRLVHHVDIRLAMKHTDCIFSLGNSVTNNTFIQFGKDIYRIYTSTSPHLSFLKEHITRKRKNTFLFFAGNGNILKGLDLTLEAFMGLPKLELFVCTPPEEDFMAYYAPHIKNASNIHIKGPIGVKSQEFSRLTDRCGFVILPSCTEGTATSVTTCMRRGLIPVVTQEAGIDVNTFGFLLKDISVSRLQKRIKEIIAISDREFHHRIAGTLHASNAYTQHSFTESLTHALVDVLSQGHRL